MMHRCIWAWDGDGVRCERAAEWQAPTADAAGNVAISYLCTEHKNATIEKLKEFVALDDEMRDRIINRYTRI
jgi:hypothetical protein